MKSYFKNILKPAPHIPQIADEATIQKDYRFWRLRTFYAMYIGYAFYYFTRKSFTFAMPAMQQYLGMDKFELGLIASILSITYGISKFLSGILGDRSNPRYFMSLGLILTGIFNICFGLSSTWWMFALFWGLNGWFQGWGWPGCAKLLTHWYSRSERGRWWSFWNTSHNLGGYLIPLIAAFSIQSFGWRYAMHIPGILCILVGFFLIDRLRDTPQSLGLPPIEKFRNESLTIQREEQELSSKELLLKYVLNNKYVWILAFASFFIYIIRTALNDWIMMYLLEARHYMPLVAGTCICWFEAGGFLGSLVAGWGSDLLFRSKRMPINILFTLGVLVVLVSFRALPISSPLIDSVYIFLFGFFIFGPQMLLGIACAELSHNKAAATATGFAGYFAYLGSAMAGGPLGALTSRWGWDGFFLALILCTTIPLLLMLPLWSVTKKCEEL